MDSFCDFYKITLFKTINLDNCKNILNYEDENIKFIRGEDNNHYNNNNSSCDNLLNCENNKKMEITGDIRENEEKYTINNRNNIELEKINNEIDSSFPNKNEYGRWQFSKYGFFSYKSLFTIFGFLGGLGLYYILKNKKLFK